MAQKDISFAFDVLDDQNVLVTLTEERWGHIVQKRGFDIIQWWDDIKYAIEHPDRKCRSKKHDGTRVYILERAHDRPFRLKYLFVFVNDMNMVRTAYFGKNVRKFDCK